MTQTMNPVLKPETIYLADNGRAICLRCAGASALYTGRDISGQPVLPLTGDTAREAATVLGPVISCEAGCTTIHLNK